MKGDFSELRFDPARHFSRVLQQQGRVQLDSDWNEQASIVLHHLHALARDLFGPHGGPAASGFRIEPVAGVDGGIEDLRIGAGRYYVDGILCENEADVSYRNQPDYGAAGDGPGPEGPPFLVFLDVWERFVSPVEDDSIREVALGGPDTSARARVVWQVRTYPLERGDDGMEPPWTAIVDRLQGARAGRLRARGAYEGLDSHLYRVEIHHGGGDGEPGTFKWSRDNASTAYPIERFDADVVTLATHGEGLIQGAVVEVECEAFILGDTLRRPDPPPLLEVAALDRGAQVVTLRGDQDAFAELRESASLLRVWDGTGPIQGRWTSLEAGIEVQFTQERYRSGDYWLLAARPEVGLRWPADAGGEPRAVSPAGIRHHYAPLAIVPEGDGGTAVIDCRRLLPGH